MLTEESQRVGLGEIGVMRLEEEGEAEVVGEYAEVWTKSAARA